MADFIHQFVRGANSTTVLALHGTGGTETDLIPLAQSLFSGANVLAPRGNISENGAARFFRRFAEGVFDIENLHEETGKLADFIAASSQRYGFETQNVVAIGYSNGANIAASLLLSHPETLAGAVLLRGMTPFEPQNLPDLSGKVVFLASGRFDPIVPTQNVENLAQMLNRAGTATELHWENASHGLTGADIEAAREFIARHFA
jgi:predicted esterase